MRTKNFAAIALFLVAGITGCSSMSGTKSDAGKDISATGPTVLNERVMPGTVELDKSLQSKEPVQVVADVKDFQAPVTDVKLQFLHVPLTVPMEKVGGSTWSATLSPEDLRQLAVSGQTMSYQAQVIATNESGNIGTSADPVSISVKTEDLAQRDTG